MAELTIRYSNGEINYNLMFRNILFHFGKTDWKHGERKPINDYLFNQLRITFPHDERVQEIEDAGYEITFGIEEDIEYALKILTELE